ncbi:MAG: hypothetical protein ACFFDN_25165, partial [Candidatus Hodarchaeota archaeon]
MITTKKFVKSIFNMIISIIAFLFPLDPNKIILANHGRVCLDSNNFFFLRYLKERQQKNKIIPYKVYTITGNHNSKGNLNPTQIRDLLVMLQTKTYLITHGSGDFFWTKLGRDPRRLFISLRHGTPLKATGIPAK